MSDPRIADLRRRLKGLLGQPEGKESGPVDDSLEGLEADISALEHQFCASHSESASEQDIATALRERVMLYTALESMIEGVVVANMEGEMVVFNAAAKAMLGRGPTDKGPGAWSETFGLFHSDGKTPFPSEQLPLARALQGESVDDVEIIIRTPEEPADRYISASAQPVMDSEDHQIAAVVVFHDITSTKVVEQNLREARDTAHEADQAKTAFLANMSHEIRTPLTAVLGFADLLLDSKLDESQRLNYSQVVRRNGEQLLALINDVLDLSKINSEQMRIETVTFSLPNVIQDAASVIRVRAHEKNLALELVYESPIPEVISSDPMRVRQILLNLLSNAVKFTDKGKVRLAARCLDTGTDKSRVQFDITDTGIGIGSEQLKKLFVPFSQVNPSTTRRYGGTGLGLSICQSLASALGGEIDVSSTPGQGSTFTFSLYHPIDEHTAMVSDPGELSDRREAADRPDTTEQMNGRILLAEDGPDNQVLITTILSSHGLEVAVAEDGEQAVEKALAAGEEGAFFDVILMDMQMPRLDGYGAASRLRSKGYTGPIIALTAHAMEGERERCLAAGCDDYLSKPVDRPRLLSTLASYLHRIRGERPLTMSGEHGNSNGGERGKSEAIYSTFADDPEMEQLVAGFVERLPFQVQDIRAARDDGDLELLIRLAHQLKGAAGGYGFMPVSEAAASLEAAAREADRAEDVREAVDGLAATCQQVCHDG